MIDVRVVLHAKTPPRAGGVWTLGCRDGLSAMVRQRGVELSPPAMAERMDVSDCMFCMR